MPFLFSKYLRADVDMKGTFGSDVEKVVANYLYKVLPPLHYFKNAPKAPEILIILRE